MHAHCFPISPCFLEADALGSSKSPLRKYHRAENSVLAVRETAIGVIDEVCKGGIRGFHDLQILYALRQTRSTCHPKVAVIIIIIVVFLLVHFL